MTVRYMPPQGCACKSPVEVDAAGHRFAELSDMLSKGVLPVVPDTPKNWEGIAEHWFSIIGDVGLPGRFCTIQAEGGHLSLGCVEGQS